MQCFVDAITTDFTHRMTADLGCHSTGTFVTPQRCSQYCAAETRTYSEPLEGSIAHCTVFSTSWSTQLWPGWGGGKELLFWDVLSCCCAAPETGLVELKDWINLSPVKSALTSKHYHSGRLKMATIFLFQKKRKKTESQKVLTVLAKCQATKLPLKPQ